MEKIVEQLDQKKKEYHKLPPSINTLHEKTFSFDQCLNKFTKTVKSAIKENIDDCHSVNMSTYIRAKIEEDVLKFEKNITNFFDSNFAEMMQDKITKTRDLSPANFINSKIFLIIMKSEILKATSNLEVVLNEIMFYVQKCLLSFMEESFSIHPMLSKAIQMEIKALVEIQRQKVKTFMNHLLNMETKLSFISNVYYMNLYTKIFKRINEEK